MVDMLKAILSEQAMTDIIDDIPEGVNKTSVMFQEYPGTKKTIVYYKTCKCGKISVNNKHLRDILKGNLCNGRHDYEQAYLRSKQW